MKNIKEFNLIRDQKIEFLKNEFFAYSNNKDYKIIAINLKNSENNFTWSLVCDDYIERFRGKQPLVQFGTIKVCASKYPIYTKIIYDESKSKRFVLTPEKEKKLKEKNVTIDGMTLIAERRRLSSFGEIWNIEDEKMNNIYENQLMGIKIGNEIFNSYNYREEVFIVKHKISNIRSLCNVKGQAIMKKK